MRTFASVQELAAAVGEQIGPGDGFEVDQQRIALFADATDDHQWIHLDQQRAAQGPFGTTIAHGFLTLSLLVPLVHGLYEVERVALRVNYGLNKVRFPAPLPAGSTVRATAVISSVEQLGDSWQVVTTMTVTADGAAKPCVVAEWVSRLYPEKD